MVPRRHFDLTPADQRFLDDYGLPWETLVDGSHWVLINDFPTGAGYTHSCATAAIRLETGYPNTELNMVYFFPGLARADGKAIGATQATQQIDGKAFQRWSRHRTAQNPWKVGYDSIGTHILLIEDWLAREFGR